MYKMLTLSEHFIHGVHDMVQKRRSGSRMRSADMNELVHSYRAPQKEVRRRAHDNPVTPTILYAHWSAISR
jgi:hypothetical protein